MPLDPQAQKVMDQVAALGLPPNHTVSPEEARANMLARPRAAGPEVAKVANQTIPNGDYQVPVRIYTPAGSGPFPILCWFHGGGWVSRKPGDSRRHGAPSRGEIGMRRGLG